MITEAGDDQNLQQWHDVKVRLLKMKYLPRSSAHGGRGETTGAPVEASHSTRTAGVNKSTYSGPFYAEGSHCFEKQHRQWEHRL